MKRLNCALGALAGAAWLASSGAQAQDLYIGTVDLQKDLVILTRCDLAANRYVLRDREDDEERPVAKLREQLKTLKAPVYAEVFGQYVEVKEDEGDGLDVIGFENLTGGKSCHLMDALKSP